MGYISPAVIAALIVLLLALIGTIITSVRRAMTFRSYEDLRGDARALARALKGQAFRDGHDLVVSGNQGPWPVVVRFSYAENTPGLDVRMTVPAGFTLWVTPRAANAAEGQAPLRIGDSRFDASFATRSDHPTQANMLLRGKQMSSVLQRLCCSTSTSLAITARAMELTELLIPHPHTADHILDHLASMRRIAEFLQTMPGADRIRIAPIRRERHLVVRIAIGAGIVAAVLAVLTAVRNSPQAKLNVNLPPVPPGLLPAEAAVIPGTVGWRLASANDFDPGAVSWLRASGLQPSGRVKGDFSGKGGTRDAAYTLIAYDGTRRLVVVAGGTVRYDVKLPYVGLIARVPKSAAKSVQWIGKAPPEPDGDGLLIVRKPDDPAAGLVLFLDDARILSGVPANYQSIRLLE